MNTCKLCNKQKQEGIDFLGVHICKDCMNNIVNTSVEDEKYEYYKNFIKKIWKEYKSCC